MKNLKLTLLLLAVFLLAGCNSSPAAVKPLTRVVTGITISTNGELHCYSSSDSLEAILAYLRHLDLRGGPVEPPSTLEGVYDITLTYSDGFQQRYQQRANCCFLDADGIWRPIDETTAMNLSKLFHLLEPDTTVPAI